MNKYIIGFLLLFSLGVNASNELNTEDEKDCRPAKELSKKFGYFNDADLGNEASFRVCDQLLLPEDAVLVANLRHVATAEDVMANKDEIIKMGGDPEKISKHMKKQNLLIATLNDISIFALPFVAIFIITVVIGMFRHKGLVPDSLLATTKVIFFLVIVLTFSASYTYLNIQYVGSYRALSHNQVDHKTIDAIRDMNINDLAPTVGENTALLSNAMLYAEFINVSTMLERRTELWGSKVEIDTTVSNTSSFDIDNPTIKEFEDYQNECEQTDYVVVDRELNFHFKDFNYSHLANEAIFYSGGETANYNCDDHYGQQVEVLRMTNNTSNLIQRFYMNLPKADMADDLSYKEEYDAIMNKLTGTLSLNMEKAEKVASKNLNMINTQMILAQGASKESRNKNIPILETSSYKALERMHSNKQGKLFDYEKIDGLDTVGNITYKAITLVHYNFSEYFGIGLDKDPIVSDKKSIGYHFLQPYIRQTALYIAELECMKSNGENFQYRKKFANRFNDIKKHTKFKNLGSFEASSGMNCYRFNGNGTITAGGDPSIKIEFEEMINDRIKAIDLYQTARNQSALKLIISGDELDNQLLLDALNSLTPDMAGSMASYTALTKTKQQLTGALNTIQDAYDITYSMSFDTSKPQTYYNYARKGQHHNIEQTDISHKLQKYDLSNFLALNYVEFKKNQKQDLKGKEIGFSKMFRYECPIINDKEECKASLIVLNGGAKEMMGNQSITLMKYYYGVGIISSSCSAFSKASEKTAGAVFSKARYLTPVGIGCALANGLDVVNKAGVKPLMVTSAIAWVATEFVSYTPTFVDMLFYFIGAVCFIIPFFVGFFHLMFDSFVGSIKYIFASDHTEQDFLKLISLEKSTMTVKSVGVISLVSLLVIVIISELLTSSEIGGALYDNFFNGYDDSLSQALIQSILRTFAFIASLCWLIIQIVFKLPVKLINQTLELTDTKGQTLNTEMSGMMQGFLGGYIVSNLGNKFKNQANQLDSGVREIGNKTGENLHDSDIENGLDQKKTPEKSYQTETETEVNEENIDDVEETVKEENSTTNNKE